MNRDELEAIAVLWVAARRVIDETRDCDMNKQSALGMLSGAIRHISRPERDIYPKTRKGTKRNPVVRS